MALRNFVQKYIASEGLKRWIFNKMSFNQFGLYYDDMIFETPEVKEAVRRLPQDVQDARAFRMQRAMQLSLTHSILPKEQWTTFEEDINNRYITKVLEEVEREKKERLKWASAH